MSSMMTRRRSLGCLACAPLFSACGQQAATATGPQEIQAGTSCDLDGMLLADYPGPKAQIHYHDRPEPQFLCDTVEMFSLLLKPEQLRPVRAVYVQDMGQADWERPVGHWVDAKQAYFVRGSKRRGSMGPTLASFAQRTDAEAFVKQWGGELHAFAQVTVEMVDLSGGALHDTRM